MDELSLANAPSKVFLDYLIKLDDKHLLFSIYGSFRHWGHPFITYFDGLKFQHENVTSTALPIDKVSAETLASDLAFKVLDKEYQAKQTWFVELEKMDPADLLYEHVKHSTWPSIDVLIAYPPTWHKLPLRKCWDIPEVVYPSLIYSDKTHSIQRSEVIDHIRKHPYKQIPTIKVLQTLLTKPSTDWPAFLQRINDFGLDDDDMTIGLKLKEREIKVKERFFALMTWALREYFVFTEYMIKKKILPLFRGLTMADDQTALLKKMISNSAGQGRNDYENITIANHLDYQKWNNFQRKQATTPVFKVMGQFFELPMLFARTHEFFERSLIYYRDRPDLMTVVDGQVENKNPDQLVCWNGQAGGLEGLREKGWSVLNLLVIERAGRKHKTEIKILAQGDNQVICTFYKLSETHSDEAIERHIKEIQADNKNIMDEIRKSTLEIGLKIKEDETLQSADMLIYGKVIIYRGKITCIEEKRYSRITCTTNDQLPGLGNVMSTVATNCLTVAHYSKSPLNAMVNYNCLRNFAISLLVLHNPALRCSPEKVTQKKDMMKDRACRIGLLYLDPILGGICGTSLTRFHIRMYPDPLTESLTFWKAVHDGTYDFTLKTLCTSFGNPRLCQYSPDHFVKPLEDPNSINVPKGLSAQNYIKGEIKAALQRRPDLVKHEIIKDALSYSGAQEGSFIRFLAGIKPCFPRFLSEFRSATYFGLTDSIIGLF